VATVPYGLDKEDGRKTPPRYLTRGINQRTFENVQDRLKQSEEKADDEEVTKEEARRVLR